MNAAPAHYSGFSLTVHWLTAILVLAQILIVWISADMPRPDRGLWMSGHKSIGLVVGLVTLMRLGVRLKHPAIPLPEAIPRLERLAARGVHISFYTLLIAMPLAGWFASTALGRPINFFWLFEWPAFPFVTENKALGRGLMELHEYAGKFLIGLIGLHVLAALKHYLVNRDGVLQRMAPFLPSQAA
jgi:cytochrome b561